MSFKKVGLTILVLSLFLIPVGATSLRIGFLPIIAIESPIGEQLYAFAASAIAEVASNELFKGAIENRLNQQSYLEYLEERHREISKGDGNPPKGLFEGVRIEFEESLKSEWVYLQPSPTLVTGVKEGETIIIDHLLRSNSLDTLLVFRVDPFDRFYRLRLTLRGGDSFYDAIVEPQELSSLKGELYLTLLNHLVDSQIALLKVDGVSSDTSLLVNGTKRDSYEGFIPLTAGEYLIEGEAPGYYPSEETIEIASGEIYPFLISLEAVPASPLLITSVTGKPTVQLSDGLVAPLPFIWPNQRAPYTIYATEPGRLPLVKQMGSAVGEIEIDLNPPWMEQGRAISDSQKKFYAALGRSLIMGAATILVDTMGRTFSQEALWQPLVWATVGAFSISTFDAAYQLFAYYQKTKYSSQ